MEPPLPNTLPNADSALAEAWTDGAMAILDAAGKVLHANEALRAWIGTAAAESVEDRDFWKLLWTMYPSWEDPISRDLPFSGSFLRWEFPCEQGGAKHWYRLELARHGGISFVQVNSILPGLSEMEEFPSEEFPQNEPARRQMFFRLLRVEGQLNNIVRRWPGVIFSQRLDLSFQFVSPKIEDLTGIPLEKWTRLPARFWEVIHEGDAEDLQRQLKQAAQSAGGVTGVYRIRNVESGRITYVLEHREMMRTQRGFLLGYEGVWLDITRQVIAEKRLSGAAWKETLAVLTMGLAHDFSNIMAGIHSISEDYQAQVGPDHPFHEGLGLIKRNSLQASQLIHRIVNLHHGKMGERSFHDLNDLVGELLDLVRKVVPRHIRIESTRGSEPLPIYADAVEFRQVLVNLALNGVDAMPQGGRLRFHVSRHESHPASMHVEGVTPRLPSVCVSIEDEGGGIPARSLGSVFDPFFTTKSMEKGSGLGLYNARLFAEKHHGAISIDSEEKKGTVVRVWLPEADFTEQDREAPAPKSRRTVLIFGRKGEALDSTAEFLRESGFSVAIVASPEAADEFLRRPDYVVAALLLLADGADSRFSEVIRLARSTRLPLKIIAQIAGRNEDEFNSELLDSCDLVLPIDLSRGEVLSKINSVVTQGT